MLKRFDVGCSNVTLNQLHTANRKDVNHFKYHKFNKFKDSVAAVYTEYFHQAASHLLDL